MNESQAIDTASFHKSNLGRFGDSLPCDLDGYIHLTAQAWMTAPMDWGTDGKPEGDELVEWANKMAFTAMSETNQAENQLEDWQSDNS